MNTSNFLQLSSLVDSSAVSVLIFIHLTPSVELTQPTVTNNRNALHCHHGLCFIFIFLMEMEMGFVKGRGGGNLLASFILRVSL